MLINIQIFDKRLKSMYDDSIDCTNKSSMAFILSNSFNCKLNPFF